MADTGHEPSSPSPSAESHSLVRHGAGFVISGIIALTTDMGVTSLLHRGFDVPPLAARVAGICVAILVAWRCHRRLTFNVAEPPSLPELMRYVAVAWSSIATNYVLYASILYAGPATAPEAALILASLGAMFVSYLGMRFGVFRTGGRFTS